MRQGPPPLSTENSSQRKSLADTLAEADAEAGEDESDHAPQDRTRRCGTPDPGAGRSPNPTRRSTPREGRARHAALVGRTGGRELEPAAVPASGHEDSASASANGADPGFFHRDEPVGSQYVDFDEVRNELVQIGIVWLGETNAVQVTALLSSTRSTIDDFVATIDTIRGLHLDGQDPRRSRRWHARCTSRLQSGCAGHDPVTNQLVSWIQDHSVLILAGLAVVEGIICLALLRMARHARHEMQAAQAAALESARAAALAAPGAIDPEAVLALLRLGHAPTLDNVYADDAAAGKRELRTRTKTHNRHWRGPQRRCRRTTPRRGVPEATTSLTSSQVEERLRQYER